MVQAVPVAVAEQGVTPGIRESDQAANHRKHGEDNQREQNPARRFVNLALDLGGGAVLSREDAIEQPEHVEGRNTGRKHAESV